MEKSIIIGILLLLVIVVGGLFYTGIIQINSPIGRVIDTSNKEDSNSQAGYPTGRVINPPTNNAPTKTREEQFLDDYFTYINNWLNDYASCLNRCPEDYLGKINKQCKEGCDELYDDEVYGKTQTNLFKDYTEAEAKRFMEKAEYDKRSLEVSSKINCLASCPDTKECINNCLR